jgi:hypothetical protein
MGCDKLKHLGELDDLMQPRETCNKEVGWEHFYRDIFVPCITKNNNLVELDCWESVSTATFE